MSRVFSPSQRHACRDGLPGNDGKHRQVRSIHSLLLETGVCRSIVECVLSNEELVWRAPKAKTSEMQS
jgi:hypothetical protein